MTAGIDKLAWLYIDDGAVLMARTRGRNTWYLPGGKREPGESDGEALIREVREELTADLIPESLSHVQTFHAQADGEPAGTMVTMTCYHADFRGEIKAAAEIEEVRWIRYGQRDQCSAVVQLILDWLLERELISSS